MTLAQERRRVAVVLIGLGVIASPLLGVSHALGASGGGWAGMGWRLAFSAAGVATLGGARRWPWLDERLPQVVQAGLWAYTAWYLWLAAGEGFDLPRAMGMMLLQVAAVLVHGRLTGLAAFQAMVVFGASVDMALAGVPVEVHAMVLGCLLAMALLASSAVWLQGMRVEAVVEQAEALQGLRDELEARVAGRTRELRREVEERRRAERFAQTANQAKSMFLANMSHELRTPLNAILGYAELVEEELGADDAEARHDVDRIQRAGRHLLAMINDVLDLARVESGRLELVVAPVALDAVIDDAVASVAPLLATAGIALQRRPGPPGLVLPLDRQRVEQVLVNLLGNAAKFAPGAPVELDVSMDEQAVRVQVRDHGPGIPADRLDAVFEPFVQVDPSTTRRQGGTGLGLAISRDLARCMGGDLTVDVTPGGGATFVLRLPRGGGA